MKKSNLVYWIIIGLSALIFLPAIKAGLVTDFTGFAERLVEHPEESILKKYGYYSIQWVTSLMMYIPYLIWDLHRDAWGIYFIALHAANGVLLFELTKVILEKWSVGQRLNIALATSLIFILHPYQVEPVVWKACISYLLCVGLMSSSLLLFIKRKNNVDWAISCFLFLLSLMTIELAFTFPVILFLFICCTDDSEEWVDLIWNGVTRAFPHICVFIFYLLWNRWVEGEFVGHYGVNVHLKGSPIEMTATISKYFYKDLFFIRHWPHPIKESIFIFLSDWKGIMAVLVPLGTVLYFIKGNLSRFMIFASLSFGLALLPISNLFFSYLLFGENDRYGYWAMYFFALLLTSLSFKVGKKFGWTLMAMYLIVASGLTWQTNQDWRSSEYARKQLMEVFPKDVNKPIILLNTPDNYNGLYMLRNIGKGSGVRDALRYIEKRETVPQITEVYQYNMTDPTNGCKAFDNDNGQLQVEFQQWGNWYWNDGIGGVNEDTKLYKTRIDGHVYYLDWKIDPSEYNIYAQEGLEWRKVN